VWSPISRAAQAAAVAGESRVGRSTVDFREAGARADLRARAADSGAVISGSHLTTPTTGARPDPNVDTLTPDVMQVTTMREGWISAGRPLRARWKVSCSIRIAGCGPVVATVG
jgi:hypothetical protein